MNLHPRKFQVPIAAGWRGGGGGSSEKDKDLRWILLQILAQPTVGKLTLDACPLHVSQGLVGGETEQSRACAGVDSPDLQCVFWHERCLCWSNALKSSFSWLHAISTTSHIAKLGGFFHLVSMHDHLSVCPLSVQL